MVKATVYKKLWDHFKAMSISRRQALQKVIERRNNPFRNDRSQAQSAEYEVRTFLNNLSSRATDEIERKYLFLYLVVLFLIWKQWSLLLLAFYCPPIQRLTLCAHASDKHLIGPNVMEGDVVHAWNQEATENGKKEIEEMMNSKYLCKVCIAHRGYTEFVGTGSTCDVNFEFDKREVKISVQYR